MKTKGFAQNTDGNHVRIKVKKYSQNVTVITECMGGHQTPLKAGTSGYILFTFCMAQILLVY